jgi:hypothetical protein
MARNGDGKVVRVGDCVGFKDDTEQYGVVKHINGPTLSVAVWDGVEGKDNIVQVEASQCWAE